MKRYLTKEGLAKIEKELEYLEKIKRREVSERIGKAAAFGDLKENASYTEAKDEQGFVEAKIRELKGILGQAEVIEKKEGDKAQMGSTVVLSSKEGEQTFQIVGPEETDVSGGKISYKSPLGEALLGKKKGDTVRGYKIVEIN